MDHGQGAPGGPADAAKADEAMKHTEDKQVPLVYSCSGCSSAAQMANAAAVRLDREGVAEMSCIAGVGGDVPSLVRVATSGRRIAVIDGCPLACARHCLRRHGVVPDVHVVLTEQGVRKRVHEDFDPRQAESVLDRIRPAVAALADAPSEPEPALP